MAILSIKAESKRHIFKTLVETAGARYTDESNIPSVLYYGENPDNFRGNKVLWILPGKNLKKPKTFEKVAYFHGVENPSLEIAQIIWKNDDGEPVFLKTKDGKFVLTVDIVNSACYFLSHKHEEKVKDDRHGRKLYKKDIDPGSPVVSFYTIWLKKALKRVFPEIDFLPMWPEGYKYAVILTHDVDYIGSWRFFALYRILEETKLKNFKGVAKLFKNVLNPFLKNPLLESFQKIIEMEKQFGFKSTFFFLDDPGNFISVLTRNSSTYSIASRELKHLFQFLRENGSEIALHGSYNSFLSKEMLKQEKEHLETVSGISISGIRQHYLRFKYPDTLIAQREAGFLYDSTVNYPNFIGSRVFFYSPYFAPDPSCENSLGILEIPLNIMDRTFTKYIKTDIKEAIFKELERVKNLGGLAVILWHNSSIDELGFSGYWSLYQWLLEYLKNTSVWVPTLGELYLWWMERKRRLKSE